MQRRPRTSGFAPRLAVRAGVVAAMTAVSMIALIDPPAGAAGSRALVWTKKTPATSPAARTGHASAYDAIRHQVVLFGGYVTGGPLTNETWTWDGTTWTLQHPATSPPARENALMAYNSTNGTVVLFGGYTGVYLNDTWVWNGATWAQIQTGVGTPSPRVGFTPMANDPAVGGVLLFGGFDATTIFNDTWVWNGVSWASIHPTVSPSARDATIAYVSAVHAVILFGGYDGTTWLNETWKFGPGGWSKLSPTTSPPARAGNGMSALGSGAVIYGGYNGSYLRDTWSFNGSDWRRLANGPSPRSVVSMAWDSQHSQVVLFGGANGSTYYGDTWVLG